MSRSLRHLPMSLVRPRLLALPLVLLCALAYVGSVMHFVLVQHATCLEHGEVVHVEQGDAHGTQYVEALSDEARVTPQREAAESHGTDAHCAHAVLRRELSPPASGGSAVTVAPTRSSPALAVFRFHAEPVARLHLAPKASPPRA